MNLFLRFLFMGAVCLLPLVGCSDDDTEGTGQSRRLTFNSRLWS